MFADDKKLHERRENLTKRQRDREMADLKKILSIPEGRRFLWRLLKETKYFTSPFHQDGRVGAFYEGKRDVGLIFYREIMEANPAAFLQMHNEMKNLDKIQLKQFEEIENEQRASYGHDFE